MKLLVIDNKNARQMYDEAGPELKKKIAETFGIGQEIMDRVKTFEDACEVLGIDVPRCLGTSDEIAYSKLKIIVKALNEGWEPDWNNYDEYKWRPWFYLDAPGFRFYDSLFDFSVSDSAGGSRLCFKSEELCKYAATQFIHLYRQLFN
jgi:hypothetical protein